jgi:hypothetical protein
MNSWKELVLVMAILWAGSLFGQENASRTFDPAEIQVRMNPEVDVVYHTLAYLAIPGDPSNLNSMEYLTQIRQGKKDLDSGPTRLDREYPEMARIYRQFPRLRFLNLALFMADDFASFKQALLSIDTGAIQEEAESSRDTLEIRRARERNSPLLFGNAKRLIPIYRKRFPEPAEQQFVKRFAECMDEEYRFFYRAYRESRTELDQSSVNEFMKFWKAEGLKILTPWAARSGATVFNVFLCPVMKNNGRAIPVNQDQRVTFNVVAPLPETKEDVMGAFFVILHETTRRSTDAELDRIAESLGRIEEKVGNNSVFYADHLYLKKKYPAHHSAYLKFFLNLPGNRVFDSRALEEHFLQSYPLPGSVKASVETLVSSLQ